MTPLSETHEPKKEKKKEGKKNHNYTAESVFPLYTAGHNVLQPEKI